MNLINSSVRVKDLSILTFFFPNYVITSQVSQFLENGVIFAGNSRDLQKLRDYGIPYIYVKGTPEYDLTIKEKLLEFVYDKWNKKPPKAVTEYVALLDDNRDNEEIEKICKQVWVTGSCKVEEEYKDEIFNLIEKICRFGTLASIEQYLKLTKTNEVHIIESALLTFFLRAKNIDDNTQKLSPKYKEYLTGFSNLSMGVLPKYVKGYLYSKLDNEELKLLDLIMKVSSGGH